MGNFYIIPVGANISGNTLTGPLISGPVRLMIDETQYGPEIFSAWNPELLSSIGIYRYIEDDIPKYYCCGNPVDIWETDEYGQYLHRTYPDKEFDSDAEINAALDEISTRYSSQKSSIQSDILYCLTIDGPKMETNLAALRAKWVTISNSESDEIMNLLL